MRPFTKNKKRLAIGISAIMLGLLLYFPISMQISRSETEKKEKADTLKILRNLEKMQFYTTEIQNRDSAVKYMNRAFSEIMDSPEALSYDMNLKIADYLTGESNFQGALDYYMTALKKLDESTAANPSPKAKGTYISLYRSIAYCLGMYDPDKAVRYLHQALGIAESLKRENPVYNLDTVRLTIYNNLGSIYIDHNKPDSARLYISKAYDCRDATGANPRHMAKLYNNLGILAGQDGELDKAEDYFNRAIDYNKKAGKEGHFAHIYLNIGNCKYLRGDLDGAARYATLALEQSRKESGLRNELLCREALAEIYEQKGVNKLALENLKSAVVLKDSLFGFEKAREGIQAELQYQYQKQKKEMELQQEKLLSDKENKAKFYMLFAVILLFGIALLTVLYLMQKTKAAKSKLEQEALALRNENLALKTETLEKQLDDKEKELSTHAEYLLNRQDYVDSVIDRLKNVSAEAADDAEMSKMLDDIRTNIRESMKDEFSVLFQTLHHDFYKNLYAMHGNLTPNEKRLCTFIRLNLSSKEISNITQQSVKAIEIARSRIRVKFGLDRKDNLNAYLQQF